MTVNGTSGELDLAVFGRDNGVFSGTFFARGTGGLAGLVGQGSFSGQDATGMGTYTFHYNTFHTTPNGALRCRRFGPVRRHSAGVAFWGRRE